MYGVFNSPWFYEDAIYHVRLMYQMRRDEAGSAMLREALANFKQQNLEKSIRERENNDEE